MDTARKLISVALLLPACGTAAEIYGTLSAKGRPLAGVPVTVVCGGETAESKPSDAYGSYRVYVRTEGRCSIVAQNSQPETVRSYSNAVRYDFEVRTEGGKTFLQRR